MAVLNGAPPLDATWRQRETVAFLSEPASYGDGRAPVAQVETHCSIVFLAGTRAYKLKRAIRFAALDYTSRARRAEACRAELVLNRRTAPALYLDVMAIMRTADGALAFDGSGPDGRSRGRDAPVRPARPVRPHGRRRPADARPDAQPRPHRRALPPGRGAQPRLRRRARAARGRRRRTIANCCGWPHRCAPPRWRCCAAVPWRRWRRWRRCSIAAATAGTCAAATATCAWPISACSPAGRRCSTASSSTSRWGRSTGCTTWPFC